jgi:GLPGLI family protein
MRLIAILSFFIQFGVFGQVSEGYFQFSIDVQAIDTSLELKQQASMLRDSRMELYFSNGYYRMDFKLGNATNSSIRIDTLKNEALSLTSSAMGSYAYKSTPDAMGFGQKQLDSLFTVTLFDEHKTILGFQCKKAVLERNGVRSTYWYTNDIKIDQNDVQLINKQIPGFPMAFTTIEKGMRFHYQVSNYKLEIENKAEVFSTEPPEDFKQLGQPVTSPITE